MVRIILYIYIALAGMAALLYLPKLLQFRYAFKKPAYLKATRKRKISVVIPARGESAVIGDLFASLQKQDYDPAFFDVNVIVKDPNDPTVAMAKAIGANVFVVSAQKCKGDALDGYFSALSPEQKASYAAFVIVDADAVLDSRYVSELNNALEHPYDIYITRKYIKNYLGSRKTRSLFSNCAALTWPIIDDLGNNYRTRNDIPLNLCGQGMMLRREVIEKIGGWPYRTLTEDYELKLDSLLRGFKSMFYPYAILYTEEAIRHRESIARRVRWLTGYSQCDRKYKQQIKAQAKERGKMTAGEKEYFFGIAPLLLFLIVTLATALTGAVAATAYALHADPLWKDALLFLVALPLGVMYLLLFFYGVLAMCACPEMFTPIGLGEKLSTLLFNPFYLLEYVPIFVKSRLLARTGKDCGWKQTERIEY